MSDYCLSVKRTFFQLYQGEVKLHFDLTSTLNWIFIAGASSRKQQSAVEHVAPLGHIMLISIQLLFALSPHAACLAEKQQVIFIVFGFTRLALEPTIYHTPAISKHRGL